MIALIIPVFQANNINGIEVIEITMSVHIFWIPKWMSEIKFTYVYLKMKFTYVYLKMKFTFVSLKMKFAFVYLKIKFTHVYLKMV